MRQFLRSPQQFGGTALQGAPVQRAFSEHPAGVLSLQGPAASGFEARSAHRGDGRHGHAFLGMRISGSPRDEPTVSAASGRDDWASVIRQASASGPSSHTRMPIGMESASRSALCKRHAAVCRTKRLNMGDRAALAMSSGNSTESLLRTGGAGGRGVAGLPRGPESGAVSAMASRFRRGQWKVVEHGHRSPIALRRHAGGASASCVRKYVRRRAGVKQGALSP